VDGFCYGKSASKMDENPGHPYFRKPIGAEFYQGLIRL
jgi:hypothetical protein